MSPAALQRSQAIDQTPPRSGQGAWSVHRLLEEFVDRGLEIHDAADDGGHHGRTVRQIGISYVAAKSTSP